MSDEAPKILGPWANVLKVRQSPMNAQQWSLDLDCGHDVWVTAKSRPTRKTARCPRCAEKFKAVSASRPLGESPHHD